MSAQHERLLIQGPEHLGPKNYQDMIDGKAYYGLDPYLVSKREICQYEFLPVLNGVMTDQTKTAKEKVEIINNLLHKYLGHIGQNTTLIPPLQADYGFHTSIGDGCFINMNAVFLDTNRISLGDRVMLGPNVSLITAGHPTRERDRSTIPDQLENLEFALPITIGDGAWLGANVIVLPGVTIGERAVIGAGSVVTHDVPPDTIVAGNPARFLKKIDQSEILSDETLKELEATINNPKSTPSSKIVAQMTLENQHKARQSRQKQDEQK